MNKTFRATWEDVPDEDSTIQPSVSLLADTVQAANAVGSSPVSESPSITVSGLASPPPAPTGLTAPVMLD